MIILGSDVVTVVSRRFGLFPSFFLVMPSLLLSVVGVVRFFRFVVFRARGRTHGRRGEVYRRQNRASYGLLLRRLQIDIQEAIAV